MRQTKYLIKEAKQNTNTVDAEAITDELCCRLLNRAQDFIMGELYNRNIKTKVFRAEYSFTLTGATDTYDLPADIYAVNAIESVQQVIGSGTQVAYTPIRQISEKDRGIKTGYFVAKNKIIFSPYLNNLINVLIAYTPKLPKLSTSYGAISAVTLTTIVLGVGYKSLTDVDDYFSVVDFNGNILAKNLIVNQTTNTLTVPSSTGAVVGAFVVPGTYSSTHSSLPDECESSLIFMLEKLIEARLSSSDINIGSILSKEQIDQIAEMFSDNSGDSFMPPIIEFTEWA